MRILHSVGCFLPLLACTISCSQASQPEATKASARVDEVTTAQKQWAESREAMFADLLAHPAKLRWADDEIREIMQLRKGRALDAYTTMRDDVLRKPSERLYAVLALQQLGEGGGPGETVAFAGKSPDATLCLLAELPQIYPNSTPIPKEIRLFVARTVEGADDWNRGVAAQWAGWRRIDEAAEPILAALRRADNAEAGDKLGLAAAQLRPSPELLTLLEGRLRPAGLLPGTKGLYAIAALGKTTTEPALRTHAAADCLAYLLEQADQNYLDAGASEAVELIASLEPKEVARQMLANLNAHARWKLVQEAAKEALTSTSLAGATETDPAMVAPAENRNRAWARSCVTHGVLGTPEVDAILKANAGGVSSEGERGLFEFMANARRAVYFDTETSSVPCRHDLLTREFASASAGQFIPEAVLETYSEPKNNKSPGRYLLQFVHGGRVYRTALRDLGDWYDVAGVVELIHRALAEASVTDRFLQLKTGDQMTAMIFGPPEALQRLATTEGVKLEPNADQSRETGQAYEKHVLKELQ